MVWSRQKDMQTENEIMQELPYPLRCRAAININTTLREAIPCLWELSLEQWTKIASRLIPEWHPPGDFLACPRGYGDGLRAGVGSEDDPDNFYVVEKGRVACVSAHNLAHQKVLEGPCLIGVRTVLDLAMEPGGLGAKREFSLMTMAPTWVWWISKDSLRAVLETNPALKAALVGAILDNRGEFEAVALSAAEESAVRAAAATAGGGGDSRGKGAAKEEGEAGGEDGVHRSPSLTSAAIRLSG